MDFADRFFFIHSLMFLLAKYRQSSLRTREQLIPQETIHSKLPNNTKLQPGQNPELNQQHSAAMLKNMLI